MKILSTSSPFDWTKGLNFFVTLGRKNSDLMFLHTFAEQFLRHCTISPILEFEPLKTHTGTICLAVYARRHCEVDT